MATKTSRTATTRATTCSGYAASHPDYLASRPDSVTCLRLPQHHGDCRTSLKQPAAPKAPRVMKAAPKGKRNQRAETILADLAAGTITAGEALSRMAALLQPSVTGKPAVKAPTTKAAPKPADDGALRFGMVARSKTGFTGRVTKVESDRVTLRATDGTAKTFVASSVTRVTKTAAKAA